MLKASVDDTKGKTLNEISRIVADINVTLRDKKAALAPQIKDLRSVRLEFQELETSYTMAKTTYENAAAGLEAERLRLEQECNNLQVRCEACMSVLRRPPAIVEVCEFVRVSVFVFFRAHACACPQPCLCVCVLARTTACGRSLASTNCSP